MLNRPIITEKSMTAASAGVFTFAVPVNATKHQVKTVVEEVFKVNVTKLTSSTIKPHAERSGRRRLPSMSAPTKVIRVWLKKGQNIKLFDIKKD